VEAKPSYAEASEGKGGVAGITSGDPFRLVGGYKALKAQCFALTGFLFEIHQSELCFFPIKKASPYGLAFNALWSRRDSNPGPDKETIYLLHA